MTTKKQTIEAGLAACLAGDAASLPQHFTDDVVGWSPNMLVTSLADLSDSVSDRDGALSEITVDVTGADVIGNKGYLEYTVSAVFSGPFTLDEDMAIEPNGRTILIGGALCADFTGDKISAFRNYFDDATLLEQMLLT
jgi:hypothetical protein